MRSVQHRPRRENSFCSLFNPQVTIAARLASFLFPAQVPPGAYDQRTLKSPAPANKLFQGAPPSLFSCTIE